MACISCLSVLLPSCPNQLIVNGGLDVDTMYRWEITDKFNHTYNGVTTTDATGLLAINIQDDPDIPNGLFMPFSGSFVLKAYKYLSPYEIENAQFVVNTVGYDCAELMFKDYKPATSYFDPNAPVYVPPFIQPLSFEFTNETEVTVTHNLGYKPFKFVQNLLGVQIGCTVTNSSNNAFTLNFDSPTSGTVYYR